MLNKYSTSSSAKQATATGEGVLHKYEIRHEKHYFWHLKRGLLKDPTNPSDDIMVRKGGGRCCCRSHVSEYLSQSVNSRTSSSFISEWLSNRLNHAFIADLLRVHMCPRSSMGDCEQQRDVLRSITIMDTVIKCSREIRTRTNWSTRLVARSAPVTTAAKKKKTTTTTTSIFHR